MMTRDPSSAAPREYEPPRALESRDTRRCAVLRSHDAGRTRSSTPTRASISTRIFFAETRRKPLTREPRVQPPIEHFLWRSLESPGHTRADDIRLSHLVGTLLLRTRPRCPPRCRFRTSSSDASLSLQNSCWAAIHPAASSRGFVFRDSTCSRPWTRRRTRCARSSMRMCFETELSKTWTRTSRSSAPRWRRRAALRWRRRLAPKFARKPWS